MADRVVAEYGSMCPMLPLDSYVMEGEGDYCSETRLPNDDNAERLDLCSDSEDVRYAAQLATMAIKDCLKHITPMHMHSSM
ncbi:hypothetical protein DYB37_006952 [Aphanomyces astaci]|uniref:Uncharacterized protein n=1 Tax=Aphanomyces astaci TaxID=112090 RepID=A0A3R6XDX3_APHAT|nr:hypothetical protein DYB35_005621 [Aphanomyces astaci]RHZ24477.1 hypothetical protein DYB37_006952 [Aphanomyces astaci]RQM12058.1 hypothetical protein B5M09_002698 [Aphanomyces astaci]